MSVIVRPERETIELADQDVESLIKLVREKADMIDGELPARSGETVARWASRLSRAIPTSLEPAARAEALETALRFLSGLGEVTASNAGEIPADVALNVLDDFLTAAEAIRHILRDALDEALPVDPQDPRAVLEFITKQLEPQGDERLAELLGVLPDDVAEIRDRGYAHNLDRLVLIARLVEILRRGWRPEGIYRWFLGSQPDLRGERPIDVLALPDGRQRLLAAARLGRAQRAS